MPVTSNIDIRQIVQCTESDLDAGASVLAKAFENGPDPFPKIATGHTGPVALQAFERAILAAVAIGGIVYFAYNHEKVVGVSLWFQPGHDIFLEKEQREAGMDRLFETFSPELVGWWNEKYRPQNTSQCERALGKGTRLNSWYLQLLGVLPEMQRRGIGAALVKVGEDRAKIDKKPVVLVSSSVENVEKFYKKLKYHIKPSGPPDSEHPEYEAYTDYEGNFAFNMWYLAKEFE